MNVWLFCKDKLVPTALLLLSLAFGGVVLFSLNLNRAGVIFVLVLCLLGYAAGLIYEYMQKRRFYGMLTDTMRNLEQKTLISELLDEPEFQEGRLCYDALRESTKAMNDVISGYKNNAQDYREYVELWMHEVKTPVATARLMIENHPTPEALSLGEEISKIDDYLEQALYYSRSNTVEKDYIIVPLDLRKVVNSVIRKNAKTLIGKGIHVTVTGEAKIYSDEKWIQYILTQIVVNAIKYTSDGDPSLKISMEDGQNQVLLRVQDNGVGIPEADVERVFDKGFTGENGRTYGKSTGIGLYLCKKLCGKLGLGLTLESKQGEGTLVTIVFPKNSHILMES